jgi:uncharacterized protein YlzI (FlbEa/FlbD family)
MRVIQLHKVGRTHRPDSTYLDTDDVGENVQALNPPQVESAPVAINVEAIRCFYQRHAERGPGTRITFKDGGGFAVTETYDEVLQQVISQ